MSDTKVLIVEDEFIVAADIKKRLHHLGFPIPYIAFSGKEALSIIKSKQPGLVLMDIHLKGKTDGIETAEMVRRFSDVPVIYLTAYTDEKTVTRARNTTPYGYIVKPFFTRDLSNTIEIALYKHKMEKHLHEGLLHLKTVLVNISDGVIAVSKSGTIAFMNPSAEGLTGWSDLQAREKPVWEVINLFSEENHLPINPIPRWDQPINGSIQIGAFLSSRKGVERPVYVTVSSIANENEFVNEFVIVIKDASHYKAAEEHIKSQAFRDSLTGLPNRSLIFDRFHFAQLQALKTKCMVGFIFLDLDGFKQINDDLGHEAGDEVLKEVANRLKSVVRQKDTVGRLAGDEFVIILQSVFSEEEIVLVAGKIINQFRDPFSVCGISLIKTVSVGLALYPRDSDNIESIMRCADIAMYHAKKSGKNTYAIFRKEMESESARVRKGDYLK